MKRHLILLFSLVAVVAAAQGIPHNMVSRHTTVNTNLIGAVVGEGLSLSNGVLSSTGGGGGTDGQTVTNIVEGIVAAATNGMVKVEGDYAHVDANLVVNNGVSASDISAEYTIYSSDSISGKDIEARESLSVAGKTLGTAAYRNANEFATATNLPALPPSATVGEIVDKLNAVIGALHE